MSGMHWGKVTRINASGVYVTIPRVAAGYEFGPATVLQPPWSPIADTGASPHDHGLERDLVVGDAVLVGLVSGSHDDVVILGRRT